MVDDDDDDAAAVRGVRPTVLISLREDPSAGPVREWVLAQVAGSRAHRDDAH